MKYIHAVKGSFIVCCIFILAVIFVPAHEHLQNIELILTVSTFLFAILSGFFISRLNSRYDKIISFFCDEDSYWLSFYRSSLVVGGKFVDKIRDEIDKYYITAFDSDIGNYYYKQTIVNLQNIYKEFYKLKLPNSSRAESTFQNMLNYLMEIEKNRNQSSVLTRERLTAGYWLVLLLLASIIVFCMFFLDLPQPYSQILTVLLSTVLVLVLLLIRDLQNLKLGGYALSFESGQEVFECIGKLRYYPQFLIKEGIVDVPKNVKKYRVGLHKPGEKPKIKIVDNRHGKLAKDKR